MAEVMAAHLASMLVRVPSGWMLTPPNERDPIAVDVDGVVEVLRATGATGISTATSTWLPTPFHREAIVRPLVPFVARIGAGGLIVEGPGGDSILLDEIDLHLVDEIDDERTAGSATDAVAARIGGRAPADDELCARLRRLADASLLQIDFDPPLDWAPAFEPAANVLPARRSRRVLRHVVPSPLRQLARDAVARKDEEDAPTTDTADEATAVAPSASHTGSVGALRPVSYLDDPRFPDDRAGGRVPVYAVWQAEIGPALSLGMLTASARHHDGGVLRADYELRRPEDPVSFLQDLEGREGPAILLCSNYVWSIEHNLDLARRAKAINPDLLIVHGGPSTPKYAGDAERFFDDLGDLVDVAVRGEGEVTIAELLCALAPSLPKPDLSALADVAGLTYRDPATGDVVRNEERDRVTDLDLLPSPYLTGEFDHIDPTAWEFVTLETNRGCPYGCTFCDWGSSTLARIRRFSAERVAGEMDWAGQRRFICWALGDANFGITSADVASTELMVAVKERYGFPNTLGFNVAKNTTKHLTTIIDRLVGVGIAPVFSLALQTRDEATLEAVKRQNISTDHYVAMAASLRRRGLPVQADLMIALPGQTVQSLSDDLQFLLDHEVSGRMWLTQLLPNAPINDPEYREEWNVRGDDRGLVVSTSTFTEADRAEMLRIRHAYTVFERFGVLRHVLRFVQWDEDVPALQVIRRLLAVADEQPTRYPLLSWILHYFDYFNAPPLGWRSFGDEVRRCLVSELGVRPSSALDAVLELQAFLLPRHGRTFPATIALDHDYLAYHRAHTDHLWGSDERPEVDPLSAYGPSTFTVYGDPLGRCDLGLQVIPDARDEKMTDNFWMAGHWELDSPLVLGYADVAAAGTYLGVHEQIPADLPPEHDTSPKADRLAAVRVSLGARASSGADD